MSSVSDYEGDKSRDPEFQNLKQQHDNCLVMLEEAKLKKVPQGLVLGFLNLNFESETQIFEFAFTARFVLLRTEIYRSTAQLPVP